ncbi:MAG: YraN family protein [Nocardioides sp.]|uniref:YraN family protein n=1 Tax=Nocardioides sp. TaxID=35761 RepID=UPI003F102B39
MPQRTPVTPDSHRPPAPHLSLGAWGEEMAARHLVAAGMVLLDRNWRCDAGEIDLVLRDGDDLVVCEVKTRSSSVGGSPHEAVDERKVARLRRLAARWLAVHQARPREVRLDMVAVMRPRRGEMSLEHVRGIG